MFLSPPCAEHREPVDTKLTIVPDKSNTQGKTSYFSDKQAVWTSLRPHVCVWGRGLDLSMEPAQSYIE